MHKTFSTCTLKLQIYFTVYYVCTYVNRHSKSGCATYTNTKEG